MADPGFIFSCTTAILTGAGYISMPGLLERQQ
jgi:hypothetical protein